MSENFETIEENHSSKFFWYKIFQMKGVNFFNKVINLILNQFTKLNKKLL